jgi:hypothetical protein
VTLDARQAQRSALAARLAEAEQAVSEAQLEATEIALEGGNDTALDRAEANIRSRQARAVTLNEAIAALDEEIAAQAAKEAADADEKLRAGSRDQQICRRNREFYTGYRCLVEARAHCDRGRPVPFWRDRPVQIAGRA